MWAASNFLRASLRPVGVHHEAGLGAEEQKETPAGPHVGRLLVVLLWPGPTSPEAGSESSEQASRGSWSCKWVQCGTGHI